MSRGKGEASTLFDLRLGQRLRLLRQAAGLRQADLAQALGVGPQVIQKYERGGVGLSAARLVQVGRVLNLPVELLLQFPPPENEDASALTSIREWPAVDGRMERTQADPRVVALQRIGLAETGMSAMTVGKLTKLASALDCHPWSLVDPDVFLASAEEQRWIEDLRRNAKTRSASPRLRVRS